MQTIVEYKAEVLGADGEILTSITFDGSSGASREDLESQAQHGAYEELGETSYTFGSITKVGERHRPERLGGELLLGRPTTGRPLQDGDAEAIATADHRILTHKWEPEEDIIEAAYYAEEAETVLIVAEAAEIHRRFPGSYIPKVERQLRVADGWDSVEVTEDPAPVRMG